MFRRAVTNNGQGQKNKNTLLTAHPTEHIFIISRKVGTIMVLTFRTAGTIDKQTRDCQFLIKLEANFHFTAEGDTRKMSEFYLSFGLLALHTSQFSENWGAGKQTVTPFLVSR